MDQSLSFEEFEQIVEQTVKELPEEFAKKLENIQIVVELEPTLEELKEIRARHGTLLFGLYRGVPRTKRGVYYSSLPDKITIFALPILYISKDKEDAKDKIRETVLHEIGHYFGMSEEQIRQAQKNL